MCQAGRGPEADRVRHQDENDRNSAREFLEFDRSQTGDGHNDIGLELDQLVRQRAESFGLLRGEAMFQRDALALDIAKIAKRLAQGIQINAVLFSVGGVPEHSHDGNLRCRRLSTRKTVARLPLRRQDQ